MTERPLGDLLLYRTQDGAIRVDVLYRDESFWMPQKAIAELFAVKVPAISKHLKNIFESKELEEAAVQEGLPGELQGLRGSVQAE